MFRIAVQTLERTVQGRGPNSSSLSFAGDVAPTEYDPAMRGKVALAALFYAGAGVLVLMYSETPNYAGVTGLAPLLGGLIVWTVAMTWITLKIAQRRGSGS